jgi:hypothetical protein
MRMESNGSSVGSWRDAISLCVCEFLVVFALPIPEYACATEVRSFGQTVPNTTKQLVALSFVHVVGFKSTNDLRGTQFCARRHPLEDTNYATNKSRLTCQVSLLFT